MNRLFLYLVKDDADAPLLAGLTPYEWLMRGAGDAPYREITEEKAATLPEGADGIAILHADTPLVTAAALADLFKEMLKRGVDGYEIGRGRVQTADAFRRGCAPKRRCAAAFAERLGTATRGLIEKALYRRNADLSAQNGAIILDADSVRIDASSLVEAGAVIEPYVRIERSVIRKGARIGSFSEIEDSEIGAGAIVSRSVIKESFVGENATVGPFAYLRMGSRIGEKVRIGDFVEVKKSTLGAGAKAAHLAYIGDATLGARTNVGCGTVFANYDGKVKRETTVGEDVFIGANTNLVAPLTVGDGAYIAAATTVTKDVPPAAFVIGRMREECKEKKRG